MLTLLILLVAAPALGAVAPFGPDSLAPVDYVLEKTKQHPIVFLGEAHWIRHDAMLVANLVPKLAEQRVVLAMETLRAKDQASLDKILSSPEWDAGCSARSRRTILSRTRRD